MRIDSIYFRGHKCFRDGWAGFGQIMPINLIIGRNNTGKSHMLDLVEASSNGDLKERGWEYRCVGTLDERTLRQGFREGTIGGDLSRGDHWLFYGSHLVGRKVVWTTDHEMKTTLLDFPDSREWPSQWSDQDVKTIFSHVASLLSSQTMHRLSGSSFRRLHADRDIVPEEESRTLSLGRDGVGATNVIRKYILSSSPEYPRDLVQRDLLGALNEVFAGDGEFGEIQVNLHDEPDGSSSHLHNHWEVFLFEEEKGLVPLSSSGSGLKTVLLVLLNLLVVPRIDGKDASRFVFAFEELENNLHPALLRRLLEYLERFAVDQEAKVFLTTHSSVALDMFGASEHAQIIHVTHDGRSAQAKTVSAHFDRIGVISELGAKPSDLLQSNGIVWVEGPSDCIYMNRWIGLYSEGRLREGRDYLCAFYGGALLARAQFASEEEAEEDLVNLFRVNTNIVVVCDGDRRSAGAQLKKRLRRIRGEVEKIERAHLWVTTGREIENYVPGDVLVAALDRKGLPDPGRYEGFFPKKRDGGKSYVEKHLAGRSPDKVQLACAATPHMTLEGMQQRFDWDAQLRKIVENIEEWNAT